MTSSLLLSSMLFVPGNRPERYAKALATGAGVVCVDLEDAVPDEAKRSARDSALAALGHERLGLRVNGVTTRAGLEDLLALADAGRDPAILFVPKVESPAELGVVRGVLGDAVALVPLIETVKGLRAAHDIAAAPGVAGLMFGGGDFAGELGIVLAWEPVLTARQLLVMAASGAGLPVIDVPYLALDDLVGLEAETRRAKAMGFDCKAAIHPGQIDTINAVFRPTPAELAEAEAATQAFAKSGGAAVRFEGRMLEEPVMRRYRRMLAMQGAWNA